MSNSSNFLTEREAWLKLAEWCADVRHAGLVFDNTDEGVDEYADEYVFGPNNTYGLCLNIDWLYNSGAISAATKGSMLDKIELKLCAGPEGGTFLWGFTKQDHERRREYCLAEANKLSD